MTTSARQLTRRQEAALTALMKHGIIRQAAKASDVPEATLRRWLRDERFAQAYRSMRRRVTENANAIIQRASEEAATRLVKLMRDENLPASVQLSILTQILDRSAASEIEERVAALEDSRAPEETSESLRLIK